MRRYLMPLILFLAGCPSGPRNAQRIAPPPAMSSRITLSPGDVLHLRVAGEKDLSGRYQISDEGTIDVPFIKRLKVAGLKPAEVTTLIRGKLAAGYLKDPQVSIFAEGFSAKRSIYIWGQVRKTGAFEYTPQMPLIRAIALAGGLTAMANANGIVVTRVDAGKRKQYATPMGEGQSASYQLQPGDVIFVPERIF